MQREGRALAAFEPKFVTVSCCCQLEAIATLKRELPNAAVLGVTVLTSFGESDSQDVLGLPIAEAVERLTCHGKLAGVDGVVCFAKFATRVRAVLGPGAEVVCPNVRPVWAAFKGEPNDQNPGLRVTLAEAIYGGATRLVVGRPIVVRSKRREAVDRTVDEIRRAVESATR